jgi:hypothetical protein
MTSTCVIANTNYKIELDNQLSKCMLIENEKSFNLSKTPFIKIKYKKISSTANCGCKSALSAYYVYAKNNNYQSFLIGGKLIFNKSGIQNLPLAVEDNIIAGRTIQIIFSCARPD